MKIAAGLKRVVAKQDKKAVEPKPHLAFSPFASDWHVPVALAIVLVLCVALVVTMQQETGEGYLKTPAGPGPDTTLELTDDVYQKPAPSPAEEDISSQERSQAGQFLDNLAGKWHGRAVHTPVGPAPYDIDFKWINGNCLAGTADNGFSHHTWTFCEDRGRLKLDFLSDFRGNDQPIFFKEAGREGDALIFMADTHKFMRVLINIGESKGRIKIIHYGELHVSIELNR